MTEQAKARARLGELSLTSSTEQRTHLLEPRIALLSAHSVEADELCSCCVDRAEQREQK